MRGTCTLRVEPPAGATFTGRVRVANAWTGAGAMQAFPPEGPMEVHREDATVIAFPGLPPGPYEVGVVGSLRGGGGAAGVKVVRSVHLEEAAPATVVLAAGVRKER